MRELIRPALFMIARTGLFLAVVAWIVGKTWWLEAVAPAVGAALTEQGWTVAVPSDPEWRFNATRVESGWPDFGYLFRPPGEVGSDSDVATGFSFSGLTCHNYLAIFYTVSVTHTLVVTILTVFNICLHWLYRKRPEVPPCES